MSSESFEKLEHFVRLKKEQESYLQICDQKISNWQKFKTDYLTLKSRLETLPHELRYDVMVPISKVAFMTGRIVNTNEILVLLGDNWFVEKSAKQSCDLIDRRLLNIEKFLEDLGKEKKILQEQNDWTKNLLQEKGEYVNIEEKYEEKEKQKVKKNLTEDEKLELRKKLQEKALKTAKELTTEVEKDRKSLYKPKENKIEELEDQDVVEVVNDGQNFMSKFEEDVKNLDYGEKFEENDELRNMMTEYDKSVNRENNLEIEKALKKQVKWSDVDQVEKIDPINQVEFYSESEEEEESEEESETEDEEEEEQKIEPIRINIKHTSNEYIEEQDRRLKLSREKPEINSPADVYNVFYKPKSILKKTPSIKREKENEPVVKIEAPKKEPVNAEMKKFEPQRAFSGEIVEKNVEVLSSQGPTENQQKKTLSKFKASKFSQNK